MTGTGHPLRVLFVCTANICRSPFMELLSRHLAGDALEVSSAGTHGFDGHPMSDDMAGPLRARGVSPDGFRSRPLTGELVDAADLVLTAEAVHRTHVLEERPAAFRTVFTLGQFAVAATAEREADPTLTGAGLVAAVGERRGPADPALDVADPYRRGPEVNAACAAGIEGLLRVVVPALTGTRMITP